MISELVVSLAVLGGVHNHLDDDVAKGVDEKLNALKFNTKEDLETWLNQDPNIMEGFRNMLDMNKDGEVDPYELAALGLEGAEATSFKMTEYEALALSEGAVREDGMVETENVDQDHFDQWIINSFWSSLLGEADADKDGVLSDEEWSTLTKTTSNKMNNIRARTPKEKEVKKAEESSGFNMSALLDFPLPANAADALVVAGAVFMHVAMANSFTLDNRRRLRSAPSWVTSMIPGSSSTSSTVAAVAKAAGTAKPTEALKAAAGAPAAVVGAGMAEAGATAAAEGLAGEIVVATTTIGTIGTGGLVLLAAIVFGLIGAGFMWAIKNLG